MGRPRKDLQSEGFLEKIIRENEKPANFILEGETIPEEHLKINEMKSFDSRKAQIATMNKLKEDPELRPFIVPNENWGAVHAILLLRLIKIMEDKE